MQFSGLCQCNETSLHFQSARAGRRCGNGQTDLKTGKHPPDSILLQCESLVYLGQRNKDKGAKPVMDSIESLIAGYRAFRAGTYRQNEERYRALAARRQRPRALIIACCDSRTDPAMVFNSDPGELFVVRNVANLVPPYEPDSHYHHGTSAALEFGVKALEIKDIIVMGHAACGGIEAIYDDCCGKPASGDFIPSWISLIEPVARQVLEKHGELDRHTVLRKLEQEAVVASLDRLRSFPFIKEREDAGQLRLHGWFYGIGTGLLSIYEPEVGRFRDITD